MNLEQPKSTGIGLEDGFVFSLDTMQSYFYSLKDRDENQKEINSFLIKVHPAGELPWMMKEQSSWQQISASPEDMITRFITIKGEIIAVANLKFCKMAWYNKSFCGEMFSGFIVSG